MRKLFTTSLLALAVAALFAAATAYAQDLQALITTDDEAALIETIQKPGDAPQDILVKNVACKRLAVIGTENAIPALVAMLPNEKLNFNARFALEAMPFESVDAALAKAAKELTGSQLVGVIDTIGVRAKADSVALLAEIGAKYADDILVTKAIYAAMGKIATPEAAAYLADAAKKDFSGADILVKRGLGDAILDVAEDHEKAGDAIGAAELYALLAAPAFPSFIQDAGLYRGIMCAEPAAAADKIVATLKGENASQADVALKTVRELNDGSGVAATKALVAAFDQFPEAMQIRVARAIGDRKDDASRLIAFEQLAKIAADGSVALKIAAAQAFAKNGLNEVKAFEILAKKANFDDADLSAAIVAMAAAFDADDFDAAWKALCEKDFESALAQSDAAALVFMKIAELRRTAEATPTLVKIAETKEGALRDGALNALSEIVTLDNLDMLVQALNGETDDAKVDWLLRAACTRLPREDCAAKVAELFEKADLDSKLKMLPLLKQIGGGTALMAVANACKGETLDKATQILGEWNTPEDAQTLAGICLTIAKQANDAKYHARGIRGYIRVARQFELPVATKIEMCKTAFETAKRAEDKALIFEVFKRNIVADNVAAALEYTKYPEFKDAACEAAVFVAEKIRDSQQDWNWSAPTEDAAKAKAGKTLVDGMKKVVETTSNADVKARAQKLLN